MGQKNSRDDEIVANGESFRRIAICGEGAFSRVFVVEHANTKQSLAMKVILKSELTQRQIAKQLVQELAMVEALQDSPFVISIYNAFQDEDYLYLTMELCEGGDLRRRMESTTEELDERHVKRVMMQLVMGISTIHDHHMLHRDLKPSNILINNDGNCVIADFSLAVYIPETTKVYENHERRLVGTFGFIAPEVYDGKPHSPKVDYFSLGVIAYKLVHKDDFPWDVEGLKNLKGPSHAEAFKMLRHKIGEEHPHYRQDLSPHLASLIQGMLRVEPKMRYGDHEVKSHAYFKGVDWHTMHITTLPPFEPVLEFGSRLTPKSLDFKVPDLPKLSAEDQAIFRPWNYLTPHPNKLAHDTDLHLVHEQMEVLMKSKEFSGSLYTSKVRSPAHFITVTSLMELPLNTPFWTKEGTALTRISETKMAIGYSSFTIRGSKPRSLDSPKRKNAQNRTSIGGDNSSDATSTSSRLSKDRTSGDHSISPRVPALPMGSPNALSRGGNGGSSVKTSPRSPSSHRMVVFSQPNSPRRVSDQDPMHPWHSGDRVRYSHSLNPLPILQTDNQLPRDDNFKDLSASNRARRASSNPPLPISKPRSPPSDGKKRMQSSEKQPKSDDENRKSKERESDHEKSRHKQSPAIESPHARAARDPKARSPVESYSPAGSPRHPISPLVAKMIANTVAEEQQLHQLHDKVLVQQGE